MMFTGSIEAKLDEKGRVFFPSSFRKLLPESEREFVLKRDIYQPCLVVFPLSAWQLEVEVLRTKLNRWNPREAMIFRQYLSDAEQFQLDSNGRFILPKRLLNFAGIDHVVTFVGVDDRIEIWAKREADFMSADDYAKAVEQLLGGRSE